MSGEVVFGEALRTGSQAGPVIDCLRGVETQVALIRAETTRETERVAWDTLQVGLVSALGTLAVAVVVVAQLVNTSAGSAHISIGVRALVTIGIGTRRHTVGILLDTADRTCRQTFSVVKHLVHTAR